MFIPMITLYNKFKIYPSYFRTHIDDIEELIKEQKDRSSRHSVKLYLIRHAESEMNVNNHIVCGRSPPTPLSERGQDQAHALGKRLERENIKFDTIYCSNTIRAFDTASIASQYIEYDPIDIMILPEITEMSQGGVEGKDRKDVYTKDTLDKINNDLWNFKHPGKSLSGDPGESIRDVENRVKKFIEKRIFVDKTNHIISQKIKTKIPVVAVFAHSNTIKAFLRCIQASHVDGVVKNSIDNTSITEVFYDASSDSNMCGWIIKRVNDAGHIINLK